MTADAEIQQLRDDETRKDAQITELKAELSMIHEWQRDKIDDSCHLLFKDDNVDDSCHLLFKDDNIDDACYVYGVVTEYSDMDSKT